MEQDSQGYSVKDIQQALNKHGYKLKIDGAMGPKTEKAISAFKRKRGWRARPWIGPLTAEALGHALPGPVDVARFLEPHLGSKHLQRLVE